MITNINFLNHISLQPDVVESLLFQTIYPMPDPLGGTSCQCADLPVGLGRKVLRPDNGLGFPKWGFF